MKKNKLLFIMLLIFPTIVFAGSSSGDDISLPFALGMEAFVSIHMSIFVLKPLSELLCKNGDPKNLFKKLFVIRIIILLIFDFFITPSIAVIDFLLVFIGAFLVVPILTVIQRTSINNADNNITITSNNNKSVSSSGVILKCTKCSSVLNVTDKFCGNCGEAFDGNNVTVEFDKAAAELAKKTVKVLPGNFDKMFSLPEDKMVEEFINRELTKANIDINSKLIPSDILKKKKFLNIIFSLLVFVYVSLIFFHFPIYTYLIGIIILFIFYKVTRNYNLMKYLKKQLKMRPSEKVSNIVMTVKLDFVNDNTKPMFITSLCVAIILPLIIFVNPRIMYEKVDNGYAVRFYTFGLTNFTKAIIPESYKNETVVSLRGNTFSNMPFLKEVVLPDTITEIRGQAFKNNRMLTKVNIPSNLEYLGGGAFYNCTSITSIELPDTVTYLGGESFYNATSLKSIKLSNNIPEIRGNTFENCKSLESITIPDSVSRIGGHAFYGNSSLSEVIFTENSKLVEIGSSAFRKCDSLLKIRIPKGVYVNSRAFKESPTKVLEFGELDYGYLIDSSQYEHHRLSHYLLYETTEVNPYVTNAKLQNAYITLLSVTENYDSNVYTLKYSDNNGDEIFELSATSPYKIINENLAVEISGKYAFNYTNKVSLNTYYN